MISHAPILYYMVYCRCTGTGPLVYAKAAADHFIWAHHFLNGAPPMQQDGPIGIRRVFCR